MALTGVQLGLCFQSYWYMWLTNGLSGLLFLGIDIGIAAFFLKKFKERKPANYQQQQQQPSSNTRRPFSPSEIKTVDDTPENGIDRQSGSRGISRISDGSSSVDNRDVFASATVEEVNKVRNQYNVSPVDLNDHLSIIAQRWATHLAQTGKLEHSPAEMRNFGRQTLGENYTAVFQIELTARKMVRKWMKEERRYQPGTNGRSETENFTQLVWQASREIGVGRARSKDGNWWYGVVVFDPPGNIPNQYANNVHFIS